MWLWGLCLLLCQLAFGNLSLDIQQGTLTPFLLGVVSFKGESNYGAKIRDVVVHDLNSSGFVQVIPPAAYTDKAPWDQTPDFQAWRLIQGRGVVQATVTETKDQLSIRFRLWDVLGEIRRLDYTLATHPSDWRRLAHIMADQIYRAVTGDPGYFDTRIVYVSESGTTKKTRRLALMDQDGAMHQLLTDGKESVITPRFSPKDQTVVYVSYGQGKTEASVYILDVDRGVKRRLTTMNGIIYAPRFTPDGRGILFSRAHRGHSHIYKIDVASGYTTALTRGPSINTSPSMSPDGKYIVFNSDRSGRKHLYTMDHNGQNIRRLSFGEGGYATPVWSPTGDDIAFTKVRKSQFYIGTIKASGSEENLIAEGFLAEGPSWSPDGQMIVFYKEASPGATPTLFKVHKTGRFMAALSTPVGAIDPSWSPPRPFRRG